MVKPHSGEWIRAAAELVVEVCYDRRAGPLRLVPCPTIPVHPGSIRGDNVNDFNAPRWERLIEQ
jgi:hypothetical protein